MAKFYKVGLSAMMMFTVGATMAQQKISITGRITDSQGAPLAGVTIREKGASTSTSTNANGAYSLSVSSNATIVVSYIGYQNQEVAVNGRNVVNVTMEGTSAAIDEVVVVGYGQQKKEKLLGSVATIDSKKLANRPVTNVSSALSGLAAGVQVKQGSGQPGSDGATIRVRGVGTTNNSNALVIIDGIQGTMDAVNPSDIENISILKDASSASIYGARAANGVILITTKKGGKGQKPSVTYSGLVSKTTPSVKPVFVSDYIRHMNLFNESAENVGQKHPYDQSTIDLWAAANADPNGLAPSGAPNYVAYPNTDWGEWVYTNGWLQNHNISVVGGGESTRYMTSARILDNPGIMHNTGEKRYEMRVNLESNITDFITVGTQTFASNQLQDKGNVSNLYNYLRQTTPGIYPMYEGKFGGAVSPNESSQLNNLLLYLYDSQGRNETSRFNSTGYVNIKFMEGLTLESKINYQVRFDESTSYSNPSAKYSFVDGSIVSPAGVPSDLSTSQGASKLYRLSYDNVLRFNRSFDKHTIGALVGYNQFYYNSYSFSASTKGLIDPTITNIGTGTNMSSIGGSEIDNSMRSFFGRINYDYDGKYLLEANVRRDGSSKFGANRKYGTFPSIALGWILSKEKFMKAAEPYVQDVKLRATWGKLGNDGGDDLNVYAWHGTYGSTNNYSFGGTAAGTLRLTRYGNNDLIWEESENKEVALEFSNLKRRLSTEINLYKRLTSGIIGTDQVPITTGNASAPYINGASLSNSGIEINMNWRDKIGDFSYSVGGNFAFNRNKVTMYKGALEQGYITNSNGSQIYSSNLGNVSSGGLNRTLEGYQLNEYYLRKTYHGDGSYFNQDGTVNIHGGPSTGMIRTEEDMTWLKAMQAAGYSFSPLNKIGQTQLYYGDLIYDDLNGDKVYGDSYDQYFTGKSTNPAYIYGFNISMAYKGFDLSMLFSGEAGGQYYWNDTGYNSNIVISGNQISERIANNHYFYDPNNPSDERTNLTGYFPRLKYGSESINNVSSDYWLYSSSFLKLRNLQIGYSFDQEMIKRIKMKSLRVFFTGENLFMSSKFPGGDPEVGSSTAKYPTMKQYAFGLNIGF